MIRTSIEPNRFDQAGSRADAEKRFAPLAHEYVDQLLIVIPLRGSLLRGIHFYGSQSQRKWLSECVSFGLVQILRGQSMARIAFWSRGGWVCVSIFQIAETHVRGGVLHPHCVYRLQEDDDDDDRGSSEQGDVLSDLKARSPKETANHRWKRTLLQLSVLPSSQPQKRQLHPLRHRTASTWDPVRFVALILRHGIYSKLNRQLFVLSTLGW